MKKILYIIGLFITCFVGINYCSAASVSVSSKTNNLVVGNTVTVSVTVSSDVAAWDFTVGYEGNLLSNHAFGSHLRFGCRYQN